jgi:hypothetical protein
VSRRTRDYLLVAGLGTAAIVGACLKLMNAADPSSALKLAATGVVVFCGLTWFIFFGVMNRY